MKADSSIRLIGCAMIVLPNLAACWHGDAAFKVSGKIRNSSGEAVGACLARVYDSDTNKALDEQRVGGAFEMTVIYGVSGIGPVSVSDAHDRVYVTVECDGHSDTFKSQPFELANASYDQPIDLGNITLGE